MIRIQQHGRVGYIGEALVAMDSLEGRVIYELDNNTREADAGPKPTNSGNFWPGTQQNAGMVLQ